MVEAWIYSSLLYRRCNSSYEERQSAFEIFIPDLCCFLRLSDRSIYIRRIQHYYKQMVLYLCIIGFLYYGKIHPGIPESDPQRIKDSVSITVTLYADRIHEPQLPHRAYFSLPCYSSL